jgi:hypothetical protein
MLNFVSKITEVEDQHAPRNRGNRKRKGNAMAEQNRWVEAKAES